MNNKGILEKLFKLKENGTTTKTEILAGITSFITIAYAILVIPNILKGAGMNSQGALGDAANNLSIINDPVVGAIFTATCVIFTITTLFMGLYTNLPYVLGPGMGLVAFFTYGVCLTMGFTWQQAVAAVFISGIVFIICTVTSLRQLIVNSLPQNLKIAMTSGIGLFIALIGLKNGGIVIANPGTLMQFGDFTQNGVLLTIIGMVIMLILMVRNVKGYMIIGIVATTLIGIPMGITNLNNVKIFSLPPSLAPTFMKMDFSGLISHNGAGAVGAITAVVMVILTFSLVDMFDTIGTLVGTSQKANMIDENGTPKNMNKALIVDSFSTALSACFGLPTISVYIESTAGIAEGGRSGLTAVVVSIFTALTLFFSGLVGIIPAQATAPVLILIGILMIQTIKEVDFSTLDEAIPAFFTIVMMPFSYSIANGIAWGIITYPIVKLVAGKRKEVHPLMYILAALFILRYMLIPQ
ncbi:NCS2 family permease [Clostridium botulinum]|uniref:NCS2 family permease n=1 Tax=Clostridium TaxID=1485 RepID=UPI00050173DA|nr:MULTISPECIES: NCS2 family permease [unclassified Clostridium]AIY81671.1 permease family protein [Clostridium botulinum 202F]KAI3348743.1 NCS2 family permease [Clostridium botulinum]KFX54588.1 guanine permease [Clostridium botulinum]KFX60335.1 guanine permease [Clostridium botulinum]KON12445.1 guanine permease [Clostridium botulinum]